MTTLKPPVISVAPMMDWTDRHCRYFHRLLAPHVRLYTEMVTAQAIIHGDRDRLLGFHESEKPLALQLGGSDPDLLYKAVTLAKEYGYDEINLNCGCPSDRVQSGQFGACLMADPERVAECYDAMADASDVPVTIKCRTGIDDQDSYDFLAAFVGTVTEAGCRTFIIHARKAFLQGLSPKENRDVPPLDYNKPARIKKEFPLLEIHLNGGLRTMEQLQENAVIFDGLMIGREAYQNPWFVTEIERMFYDSAHTPDREEIALKMMRYARDMKAARDTPVKSVTRHMTGLFQGQKGARAWRRALSEEAHLPDADACVIEKALQKTRS